MFWLIAAILLAFGAGLWFILAPGEKPVTDRYGDPTNQVKISFKPFGWIPAGLAVVCLILSCFAVVGTKNVGVPTVFGKPTGDTYGSGLNFKAPWTKVTDIDGTTQPEEYRGDSCIIVKIADGGSGCVTAAYRWRINQEQADVAFADYRNSELEINDAVRAALVTTNMKAAINEVFGTWDPLEGSEIKPNMTPEELANAKVNVVPDYGKFNQEIEDNFDTKIEDLGGLIDLQSVTISYVALPETTQDRINAYNRAVQDTKIALQEVATKAAQADGNRKLAASLQDPNVLVSKCLDSLAAGEFEAPPGFSCWSGGGGGVVLPAAR